MKKNLLLCGMLCIGVLFSCCVGKYELSLLEIWHILQGNPTTDMHARVFWQIRLSRTVLVAMSGGVLALAGFVYQSLFRNPLVSPDVLGVSSGASVGAIAAILVGGTAITVQIWAFVGGIVVVLIALLMAQLMGGNRLFTMILSGIIMGSFANAIIMTLKYTADPERQLSAIEYWLMGSFHATTWASVTAIAPLLLVATGVLYALRPSLRVVALGDEEAQSLGVPVRLISTLAIVSATLLVSCVVSVAGVVAWIGLLVPHMVRLLLGEDYLQNFTQSILVGALLLLLADVLVRAIFAAEVPIGILTSAMGGLFLLFFLYHRNRQVGA